MDEQQRRELITSLFQSGEANKLSNVNTIDQAMADMFGSVMGATGAGRTELMNLFRSMIEGGLNLDELITNIGGGAPGAN
jgi:sigma54-dependent transcription regulator